MGIRQDNGVDNVTPKDKWEFDSEVARCFADMLERSIPDYKSMRGLIYELGEKFITPWNVDHGYRMFNRPCGGAVLQKAPGR